MEANTSSDVEFEDLNLNAPEEITFDSVIAPTTHEWEQRGTSIACTSCTNSHGMVNAIPVGHMLTKTEKGDFNIVPMISA